MDYIMKELAHDILNKIEALEKESNFDHLLNLTDEGLRSEAEVLYQEIEKLKNLLVQADQKASME